jgi:hypothetical protein
MVPAEKLAAQARRDAAAGDGGAGEATAAALGLPGAAARAELAAERDRLTERFALLQADLGGAFYEMAIRDHVRIEVLTRKAAELQRVDQALEAVERELFGLELPR